MKHFTQNVVSSSPLVSAFFSVIENVTAGSLMDPKEENKTCLAELDRRDSMKTDRKVNVVNVKTACRAQETFS